MDADFSRVGALVHESQRRSRRQFATALTARFVLQLPLCHVEVFLRSRFDFFRYKRNLGDRLRARDADAQVVEARLACNIFNRMAELGMSASFAVRV
ncbi:MAG: alkylhydroperoxidase family enzyme [Planctomycetota bacterium]